jgi:uncharacterized surface anchored protein
MVALVATLSAGPASAATLWLETSPVNDGQVSIVVFDAQAQSTLGNALVEVRDSNGEVAAKLITDDSGAAGAALKPGAYKLQVSASGYVAGAAEASVAPGEITGVKVGLQKAAPSGSLTLRVTNGSSRVPVAGAGVQVRSMDGAVVAEGFTSKLGTYNLNLAAGTYVVTIKATGFARGTRTITIQPDGSGSLNIPIYSSSRS